MHHTAGKQIENMVEISKKIANQVSILLFISVAINMYLMVMLNAKDSAINVCIADNFQSGVEFTPKILNKDQGELKSEIHQIQRSDFALQQAAKYSGSMGNGFSGWLWLLSATDIFKGNFDAMDNLISNYLSLNNDYSFIAYSELKDSALGDSEKESLMPLHLQQIQEGAFQTTFRHVLESPELPPPCSTQAFTTLFSTWRLPLESHLSPTLNDDIFLKSVAEYEHLKAEHPGMSSTDLNHALFNAQMAKLETSSTFWGNFQDIEGFSTLVMMMRKAAFHFLVEHGIKPESALRKAAHPLVVWVSVHTAESEHQPHVTQDALVGGVYYVRVPKGSGLLEMYDPRGKHPLRDLDEPTSPPNPPFHRTVGVKPEEGKLILFPGWLVHSVLRPSDPGGFQPSNANDSYRVSLSFNLKGEWQDTASLHLTNCTYEAI